MIKSKVYLSKIITPEQVVKMIEVLDKKLTGNVAIKVHSGEKGNQNFLRPPFYKAVVDYLNGTIVESNTAYPGMRNTTKKHLKLMAEHEWSKYFSIDILDEKDELILDIPSGKMIQKNYVGKNIEKYDSMLVLSHFKGHQMGGYGGALKQLSIGIASSFGKAYIHGAGDPKKMWIQKQDKFLESMVDAALSIIDYFQGKIIYVNVMCNISVDCDCNKSAAAPCMHDIGILSSTDPVALDQACVDLIYNSADPAKELIIKRIESKNGLHTIEEAAKRNIGSRNYELIEI